MIDSTSLVLYVGWRNNRLWRLKLGMKICTEKWGPFPTKKNLAEFISTSIKRILHMVVKIRVSKWTLTESESTEAVQLVHEEVSCRTPYKPIRTTAINCYATNSVIVLCECAMAEIVQTKERLHCLTEVGCESYSTHSCSVCRDKLWNLKCVLWWSLSWLVSESPGWKQSILTRQWLG